MTPSISTAFFAELPPEEALELLSAAGYAAVEVGSAHADQLMQRGEPAATGEQLAGQAARLGLALPQGHLRLLADIADPDPAERRQTLEHLKRQLTLFAAAGIKAAVLHPGGNHAAGQGWTPGQIAEVRTASLLELADAVRDTGCRIALETMYHRPFGAPELLEIIARAGHPPELGVCLDTGHLNIAGQEPAVFPAAVGELLIATHIADNSGQGDEHLFPYAAGGTIDWPAVVDSLYQAGYRGLFNFEPNGERDCPLEVKLAKAVYSRQLAEAMLHHQPGE